MGFFRRSRVPGNNGRRLQVNLGDVTNAGAYPFVNQAKHFGRWTNISGGTFDVSTLDANGYPTSLSGSGATCTGSIAGALAMPGNWVLTWDGDATLNVAGATLQSGSYTGSGGSGRAVVSINSSSNSPRSLSIQVTNLNGSSVSNIRFCLASEEAAMDGGQIFRTDFLTAMQRFGVIRFLDWGPTNFCTLVNWADRKPVNYFSYGGTLFIPSKVVPAANVSYSTGAYTATFANQSGALAHGTTIIWKPGALGAGGSTLNLNGTGAIPIKGIYGAALSSVADVWVTSIYDSELNVWLSDTAGNQGITHSVPYEMWIELCNQAFADCWVPASYLQVDPLSDCPAGFAAYARDNLRSGLKFVQETVNELWNEQFYGTQYSYLKMAVKNGGTSAYTVTGGINSATTGAGLTRLTIGANTTQVGSNLALSGIGGLSGASGNCRVVSKPSSTDIIVNLASTGTYTSGGTATPNQFDRNSWVGLTASRLGQMMSSVFGGDRSRYEMLIGFQTFGTVDVGTVGGTNQRLDADYYVLNSGLSSNAAYNWHTGISPATYYHSGLMTRTSAGSILETIYAFEYQTATTQRKSDILTDYVSYCGMAQNAVTISGISKGATTTFTTDRYELFRVTTNETIIVSGVTPSSYNGTHTVIAKTPTSVTVSLNSSGFSNYVSGGSITPEGTTGGYRYINDVMIPRFLPYVVSYGGKIIPYEGGYSPDYGANIAPAINTISNAAQAVVDIGSNIYDDLYNNKGFSGLSVTISDLASSTMGTLLNGNTYTIVSASPTTITINVDTSSVSAYPGSAPAKTANVALVNANTYVNALRQASKQSANVRDMENANYAAFMAIDPACQYPSQYNFSGAIAYGMWDPDMYASPTPPRWLSVLDYS